MSDIRSIYVTTDTRVRRLWPAPDPHQALDMPPWLALALLTLAGQRAGREAVRWVGREGAFVAWCLREVGARATPTRLPGARIGAIVRTPSGPRGFALGVCAGEVYLIGAEHARVNCTAFPAARIVGYEWPGIAP